MSKRQSGVEIWSFFARSSDDRETINGYLPLILSAAGALCIAPFAVLRFLEQNWLAVAIDTILIVGIVVLGTVVYRTQQVRHARLAIAVLAGGGLVGTVYAVGPGQVYWAYPALIAIFYLLRPSEAIILGLAVIAMLIPAFLSVVDPVETTTVFISIVLASAFAYAFSVVTNQQRAALIQLATKDPLTGAGNRRALETKLADVVAKRRRQPVTACLIMLDLDHFKAVNDRHGHAAGDEILKALTDIVRLRIRVTDSLFRIGGEEFVIVLDGENLGRGEHLAEQLRTLVEANELIPDQDVTISLGVAELGEGETPLRWLERADEAMYEAKRRGRNVTRLAS